MRSPILSAEIGQGIKRSQDTILDTRHSTFAATAIGSAGVIAIVWDDVVPLFGGGVGHQHDEGFWLRLHTS